MDISDFTIAVADVSVDTLPLFVQLAADTPAAYQEIDLLYDTDAARFQQLALSSQYYGSPLFTNAGIDRQKYADKYIGILLAAIAEGTDSLLFESTVSIMTKRWTELYGYIVNCTAVDLSEVANPKYYSTAAKKTRNNLLTGASANYIRSFISMFPVVDLPLQASLKFALFLACALGRKVVVSDSAALPVVKLLGKVDSTDDSKLLRSRLNKPVVKKLARHLKNVIYQKNFCNYLDPWNDDLQLESLAQCSAYLSLEEEVSLLIPNFMMPIKDRDVEILCQLYIVQMTAEVSEAGRVKKSKEDMELECAKFVMFGLILLKFIREYKKIRKYYIENNATDVYAKIGKLKKQFDECEMDVRRIKAELAAKTALLAAKDEGISNLVIKQKFAMNALLKENEQLKAKLKRMNYASEQEGPCKIKLLDNISQIPSQKLDTEAAISMLENIQALVIGGTENWQTKLKGKLPHFTYLYGDASTFDESLIVHADIVFANVRYKFAHDCFYKMIKLVRQHGNRLVFLSKTNIPLTIRQMANALSDPAVNVDYGDAYEDIGCGNTKVSTV